MKLFKRKIFLLLSLLLALHVGAKEEERSFSIINAASGLADNSAQIIKCTKTGRLIISTIGNLNFFDGKSFSHADAYPAYEYPLPLYRGHYHLYFDRSHHIWLKDKRKVMCLDLRTERYVQNVDSVIRGMGCSEPVLDLFADQNNSVWFVTAKGLFHTKTGRTYQLQREQNLQDVDVFDNNIYTFYDNGEVVGLDTLGNMVCHIRAYDWDVAQKYVSSSVLQPYGDGFFQIRNGDAGAILLFFNVRENTFETILEQDYHLNNMTLDRKGENLYVPCEYGYWIYRPATRETEHIRQLELTSGQVMETDCNTMTFDHQGGLWIGTEKRGVLYARPHSVTFRSYAWGHELAAKYAAMMDTLEQNISEYMGQRANCKYVDSRGWAWIGTREGLYLERPGIAPRPFTRRQGMNNEVVHAVVEDADHNIWVSTSCGISFFLIRDGQVAFINNFTESDNVPTESFVNSKALLLPDSSIVMQGIEHVVVFHPKDLREVNEPHLITNIKPKLIRMLVNGNPIEPGIPYEGNIITDRALTRTEHINLKSDQNSISLTFSALNYFRPMQTYYRVRVYELDNKWKVFSSHTSSMVDDKGLLHFPMANLLPGDYQIEVQSSMFPDVWEEDLPERGRFIWKIHVKQPWWRTTGLLVLLGTVLLAMLLVNFFLYNRNTRMRDRRNNEEGDIIRKISFFVERCDAYAHQPLAPMQSELAGSYSADSEGAISPEFIELMFKIMPYVKANENRTLTMRKLSEVGGIDIQQLYGVVTGNLYKNPRALARLIKLRKGAELLRTSEMTVEQVAVECGFYTPNYFIGNFFHEYKQTPMEYRQSGKS